MRLILVSPPISRCTQLLSGSVFCGHGGDETHKNSKRSLNHHQITAMPQANCNSFVTVSPCYLCDRDGDNEN